MDNSFLIECRNIAQKGLTEQEKRAYESIITILFKMKLHGKAKARQIDEYDGESLFKGSTLYPGQIYAFIYRAETPTVYDDGKTRFEYYDSLPIVLITHAEKNIVRGINLNLCNYGLRAFILNTLHNLDLSFYQRGNLEMVTKGQAPISNNVARTFLNADTEKKFYEFIKASCHLKNTGFIYRSYAISRIQEIRMIEVWQHKYIPFLTYTGEIKKDILETIHRMMGITDITI